MSYYLNNSEILFSRICSDNIYRVAGNSPSFETMMGEKLLMEVEHIKSKEKFLCYPCGHQQRKRTAFVLNAIATPMLKAFVWPSDLVSLGNNDYWLFKKKIGHKDNKFENLMQITRGKSFDGFETPRIKDIVFNYLNALDNLFKNGYIYRYWDERMIFVGVEKNEIVFQFHTYLSKKNNQMHLKEEEYYSELTDPFAFYHGNNYDFYSDMYSYQTVFFKLLVGMYPFEGKNLLYKKNDDSISGHQGWVMHYMRNVYFVFDEDDRRNRIGVMGEDIPRVKRWEALPQNIQNMFRNVFKRSNVLRENETIICYSPQEWIRELQKFDFKLKK